MAASRPGDPATASGGGAPPTGNQQGAGAGASGGGGGARVKSAFAFSKMPVERHEDHEETPMLDPPRLVRCRIAQCSDGDPASFGPAFGSAFVQQLSEGGRANTGPFRPLASARQTNHAAPICTESLAIVKMSPRKGEVEEVQVREVKNMKYWVTKIGHVFRRVRQVKKRRKSSMDSLFSSIDDGFDDMGTESVHYKPEAIDTLCELTKFSKRELQLMYRGFKQECPSGMVREETFKGIYAQFFPRGADSSQYAHFVFNTFDQDHTGAITFTDFVVGMSVLARGSVQEKLRWAFNLYDINGDGYITKDEMTRIVAAIYDLMGKAVEPVLEEHTTREHVDRVFQKLDLNNDGVVTIDEFLDSCNKDENITQSMSVFNTEL